MTRVGLVSEPIKSKRHNPIQNTDLLRSSATFAKTPTNLEFEVFGKLRLIEVEIFIGTKCSEIITVNDS